MHQSGASFDGQFVITIEDILNQDLGDLIFVDSLNSKFGDEDCQDGKVFRNYVFHCQVLEHLVNDCLLPISLLTVKCQTKDQLIQLAKHLLVFWGVYECVHSRDKIFEIFIYLDQGNEQHYFRYYELLQKYGALRVLKRNVD